MLDVLMTDQVTVRRAKPGSREASGKVQLEQVLDVDNTGLYLACKFQERGRRIVDSRGVESRSDATLLFRADAQLQLRAEDIVVTADGRAWRVAGLDTEKALFTRDLYGRADLVRSDRAVPPDKGSYGG